MAVYCAKLNVCTCCADIIILVFVLPIDLGPIIQVLLKNDDAIIIASLIILPLEKLIIK